MDHQLDDIVEEKVPSKKIPCRSISLKLCLAGGIFTITALTLIIQLIRDLIDDDKLLPILEQLQKIRHGMNLSVSTFDD